jgi:uncharacterized membrane protein YdjX (TVP38/TMEM64 family)
MKGQHVFKKNGLKLILIGCILLGGVVLFKTLNLQIQIDRFLEWVPTLGVWAPLIFILMYVLAATFFIPASALTLGAGAIFGVIQGSILVSIASTGAAVLSFLIGRYAARSWISKKVERNQKFKAIDEAVAAEGWKIVGLTRLSPIFPFALLNYGYGITKVSLRDYALASWIGMMPGTVMYVYLGAVAGTLVSSSERTKSLGEWALLVVGLVATIGVTIYITKIAKKAISKKIS